MKRFKRAELFALLAVLAGVLIVQARKPSPVPTSFATQPAGDQNTQEVVPMQSTKPNEEPSAPVVTAPKVNKEKQNEIVLDRTAPADERRQVLQKLVEAGPAKLAEMAAIAKEPIPHFPQAHNPHSTDSGLLKFEKGLRITAIETLDQWAVQGADVLKELKSIRDTQNQQDLVFLAGLAVEGILEGRPGKTTRFIDQAFDEALNGK